MTPEEQVFMGETAREEPSATPEQAEQQMFEAPATISIPIATAGDATVSYTFRMGARLNGALVRAALERKYQRQIPFTQRDIVSEALADWLRKHGYAQ